eukprot:EST45978.1 Phosphoinositide polyphosphatase [Spironucleus salmonicida]
MLEKKSIYFGKFIGIKVYGTHLNNNNNIKQFTLTKDTSTNNYEFQALRKFFNQPGFFINSEGPIESNVNFSRSDHPLYFGYYSKHIQVYRFNKGQGKRFFSRGILRNNFASNGAIVYSYGQKALRGGPACSFNQVPDLKPKPEFQNFKNSPSYIKNLVYDYKNIFMLSLIDMKNRELLVAQSIFDGIIASGYEIQVYSVSFVLIQCKDDIEEGSQLFSGPDNMDSERIKFKKITFFDQIEDGVYIYSKNFHYFHLDYHKIICGKYKYDMSILREVFDLIPNNFILRVNCIDSLDRTGAVLSYYFQLQENNHSTRKDHVTCGNILSQQYASTNSMKQDQQEFNIRTLKGKIQDINTWFLRWVRNNHCDGKVQDGYTLVQYENLTYKRYFTINIWYYLLLTFLVNIASTYFVFKYCVQTKIDPILPCIGSVILILIFQYLMAILLRNSLVSLPRYTFK